MSGPDRSRMTQGRSGEVRKNIKIYYKVKKINIQNYLLNVKISAIIKDKHLKFSVIILDIVREGI